MLLQAPFKIPIWHYGAAKKLAFAETVPPWSAAQQGCSILGNYEETYRSAGNVVDSLYACVDAKAGAKQEVQCAMSMGAL